MIELRKTSSMKYSIEGDNNGFNGALGNNVTELKETLLSNFERLEAVLLEAKSTASRQTQQYEELRQMDEARVGMLEVQLQEKEESLRAKESAIKQLEESLTAKIQELEHRLTEKEDLTGLLEQRTAEITNLRMAKKKNIMVVDDNPDIVTIVKTFLEVKGYKVQSAYSGQEVLNLLAKQKPDLILLDIMMPRMDGLEVLTRLKGDSNTRPIPVVLLTAKQPDEAILGGYDIWADSYITKPFTNTQLLNVINRLIGEA